jgi:uncharacterized Fe-S cluster protein YjdI
VSYDVARCIHAGECVRGLPAVFDTKQRPWIQPDGGEPDEIAEVIRRCPSGALHYELPHGAPERPARPTQVSFEDGGPMLVAGELQLELADGPLVETRAALCVCGRSGNRPFCDHACKVA